MAKENIAKFFGAAMTDKALAEKAAALAAESGYDFTAAELLELGTARPLSDEELENTGGGGSQGSSRICTDEGAEQPERPLSDDEAAGAAGGWLPGFLSDLFG